VILSLSLGTAIGLLLPTMTAANSYRSGEPSSLAAFLEEYFLVIGALGALIFFLMCGAEPNRAFYWSGASIMTACLMYKIVLGAVRNYYAPTPEEIADKENSIAEDHIERVKDLTMEIHGYATALVATCKEAKTSGALETAGQFARTLSILGNFTQQMGRLNLEPIARMAALLERTKAAVTLDNEGYAASAAIAVYLRDVLIRLDEMDVDPSALEALRLTKAIGLTPGGTLAERLSATRLSLAKIMHEVTAEARRDDISPERRAQLTVVSEHLVKLVEVTENRSNTLRDVLDNTN